MTQSTNTDRWTPQMARQWYDKLPWLVGCNYTPRTAINQLEMWQADTFDAATIDQELGWGKSIGMNSIRVFLHDLVWQQDQKGFVRRVEHFLSIADRHGIGVMFVFFDSVWHPFPYLGRQRDPEPGVHNSYWLQSPGVAILRDRKRFDSLEEYVTSFVSHFKNDTRVHVWDLWNEPDNNNGNSRGVRDIMDKGDLVAELMPMVFAWARAARPSQPLTSGIWAGDWTNSSTFKIFERVQVELSDVISFHNYGPAEQLAEKIEQLQAFDRPLLCTEYMARGVGSTFAGSLPVLKEHKVAAYNWGLVQGKTQTHLPWDSWQRPYTAGEPQPWFHEVFRPDGQPYDASEVTVLKTLTARAS